MKHDKLKSECFKISTITGQANRAIEQENDKKDKKKQRKLKSIQKIIDKNKSINDHLSQKCDHNGKPR